MAISIFVKSASGVSSQPVVVISTPKDLDRTSALATVEAQIQKQEEITTSQNWQSQVPDFGKMIKEIRTEQNLSQRQLAELSGVNRNVLRRLENEGGSSSVAVLCRLAEILGYELDLICVKRTLN